MLEKSDFQKLNDWYEEKLPKPQIPSLKQTFERYLQYAQTIADSSYSKTSIEETNMAISRFIPVANKLQNELRSLSNSEDNWRSPLPVNFNPAYVFPVQDFKDEDDYLDYTAWIVRGFMEYKEKIIIKAIPREVNRSRVNAPLCMDQYDRILNSYREASFDIDIQQNRLLNQNNEHVLVMCERQTFVLFVKLNGELVAQSDIFNQLRRVVAMAVNRDSSIVLPVGAATVGNRDDAARFWLNMKKAPINVASLHWVQTACFAVCLDKGNLKKFLGDNNNCQTHLESGSLQILHGFGSKHYGLNRWFEATIQLIVTQTGFSGLCIEHSVAEGIVIINMAESALRFAYENRKKQTRNNTNAMLKPPRQLSWVFDEDAKNILDKEMLEFDSLTKALKLRVLFYDEYGKDMIKSLRVSPDGFVQLSMQLAHYRLHGYLVSTYESASVRKFRLGRVDNIRAATPEALSWVKSMVDSAHDSASRLVLFREAANKQSIVTQENVNGNGIDNHLCALEVLAKNAVQNGLLNEVPEIFKQKMWTELMNFSLSTSQVTTSPEFVDCYLFYGPVVEYGYGCAYNIQKDKIIYAITSFGTSNRTDIDNFRENVVQALREMRDLLITETNIS